MWLFRELLEGPYLALCLDEASYARAMRHLDVKFPPKPVPDGKGACMHACTNQKGEIVCVICLFNWQDRDPISIAGLLTHEAVHVWQDYCRDIGEKAPGDEIEAYAIQRLSQRLMWRFVELTRGA